MSAKPVRRRRIAERAGSQLRRFVTDLFDLQVRVEQANRAQPYGIGAWWSR